MALGGGDDYQLCFTVPRERRDALMAAAADWTERPVRIGRARATPGLALLRAGRPVAVPQGGWDHFREAGS
jgi:thiamine-monophosphate kinase